MRSYLLLSLLVAPGFSASLLPFLTNTSSSVQESLLSVLNKTAAKTSYIANKLEDTLEGINLEQHLADISKSSLAMVTSIVDSNPLDKVEAISSKVIEFYNSIDISSLNVRFHLIYEKIVPDLSSIIYLCPEECSTCALVYLEILCRICCPDLYDEPMNVPSMLMDHFDHFVSWITKSSAFKGLKVIYQTWARSLSSDSKPVSSNPTELKTFIRNFQWMQVSLETGTMDHKMEPIASDLVGETFLPETVCGYYEQGGQRAPQGRVMGGSLVGKSSMFPWQLSLATGYYGVFYQHRCGASLLSQTWAVTAAHCTNKLDSPAGLVLMGGFTDMNNKETAQIRSVETILQHPLFLPRLYENDICLLKMKRPVVFTPSLLPVCLPPGTDSSEPDFDLR